jgi:peptidoglycan-N-acetylglucosamine deacetylase
MADARWKPTFLIRASLFLHAAIAIFLVIQPMHWRIALMIFLADHALLTLTGLLPRSHWLGPNWTRLPKTSSDRLEIALTIDDGPDPVVTPKVLDILDRYSVKATFFCIGEKAALHPELCRDIVARGHAVENHSQHHRHHFSLLGYAGLMRELEEAQSTLTEITGQAPLFFRAPAGLRNPFLDPVLAKLNLRLASWSVRAYDTRNGNAIRVAEKLLSGLKEGAILLLHDGNSARTQDGNPVILEVLPAILSQAKGSGFNFITLRAALS